MHFLRLISVASLACLAAATGTPADIKADVTTLSGYLKQLSGDVDQFNSSTSGIPFALQIQIDSVNIDKVVAAAKADADATQPLNDNDSLNIGLQLVGVSDDVSSTLKKVQDKAGAFGELKPLVLNSLYALKRDTDAFGAALTPKLSQNYRGAASTVTGNIDKAFNNAIVAYGGRAT